MLLCDREIAELATAGMIDPFVPAQVRQEGDKRVISYGLSSAGYDIRLADEYKIFHPQGHAYGIVDPKNFNPELLEDWSGEYCIIPPNSYILAHSFERMALPRTIVATVLAKSTYARVGVIVNVTPGEPGWEGYWTIEISNSTPLPVKVYSFEGIAQVQFHLINDPLVSYKDRGGKYQNQGAQIVLPRL